MALTKIQPSALDLTQNYSVNQLSANTVLDGGIEVISVANSAFDRANAGFAIANAAGSSAMTTSAYGQANLA